MKENNQLANVIPLKRYELFPIFRAEISSDGSAQEGEQLGFAFLKPSGQMFRLKFWMFPKGQYFLSVSEDRATYRLLSPSRESKAKEKTYWNEVGSGFLDGRFIRIQLYLPSEEILVSLYRPAATDAKSNAS